MIFFVLEVIIFAVIALLVYKLINNYIQQKSATNDNQVDQLQLQQEINEIKQRLRNLENIVTDDDYDIKQKMKQL